MALKQSKCPYKALSLIVVLLFEGLTALASSNCSKYNVKHLPGRILCDADPCCVVAGSAKAKNWACHQQTSNPLCPLKYPKKEVEEGVSLPPSPPKRIEACEPIKPRDPLLDLNSLAESIVTEVKPVKIPKPHKPPQKPKSTLSKTVRDYYTKTKKCPENLVDIKDIKKLAEQEIKKGSYKNVDVTPLISNNPESRLSLVCGFNSSFYMWFSLSFYCKDQNNCFDQGTEGAPKDCGPIARSASEEGIWIAKKSCQNRESYRINEDGLGDHILIAIGDGIYIHIVQKTQKNQSDRYYYGLIIAPK